MGGISGWGDLLGDESENSKEIHGVLANGG